MKQIRAFCTAMALLVMLLSAGCATYSPRSFAPGTPVGTVTRAMGSPSGEYVLPEGARRLEFARGPYGKHTYMVDFDAQGGLRGFEQVLTEARFNAIREGMTAEQVLMQIGHSLEKRMVGIAEKKQIVWAYRYDNPFCQWFQVGMDLQQARVIDTAYGPDPMCDKSDRDVLARRR